MKITLAALNKEGENVVDPVLDVLKSFDVAEPLHFGLTSPKQSLFDKNLALLSKQSVETAVLVGYATSQSRTASGYQFLQLADASVILEGRIYAPIPQSAVAEQLAREPQHCETTLQTLVEQADGDYMFMLLKDGSISAGRDPIGVQPLYYGENTQFAAFATNKRALWRLSIENVKSFPPGNLGVANKDGFRFKPVRTLTSRVPTTITIGDAAKTLQELLVQSIRRRVQGLKEVAVAFSGGLDSGVVAHLAAKSGAKVNLLHVSLENQPETEEAIDAAEALGLPLEIDLFKDSDVEKALPKVVELIEEPNPVKASIGIPFFWMAEKAAEAGYKVVLAGQGADELFGGYQRYVNEYCREGSERVRQTMFNDVVGIYESNLERDIKVTGYFDVELRLPFASFAVADFALGLPLECKLEQKPDTLRKLVLRQLARDIGMPSALADKPKKAVQYSTGVSNAVKRLAKAYEKTVSDYIQELFEQSRRIR